MRCLTINPRMSRLGEAAASTGPVDSDLLPIVLPGEKKAKTVLDLDGRVERYVFRQFPVLEIAIMGSPVTLPNMPKSILVSGIYGPGAGSNSLTSIEAFLDGGWTFVTPESQLELQRRGIIRKSMESPVSMDSLDQSLQLVDRNINDALELTRDVGDYSVALNSLDLAGQNLNFAGSKVAILRNVRQFDEDTFVSYRDILGQMAGRIGNVRAEIAKRQTVLGGAIEEVAQFIGESFPKLGMMLTADIVRKIATIGMTRNLAAGMSALAERLAKIPSVSQSAPGYIALLRADAASLNAAYQSGKAAAEAKGVDLDKVIAIAQSEMDKGLGVAPVVAPLFIIFGPAIAVETVAIFWAFLIPAILGIFQWLADRYYFSAAEQKEREKEQEKGIVTTAQVQNAMAILNDARRRGELSEEDWVDLTKKVNENNKRLVDLLATMNVVGEFDPKLADEMLKPYRDELGPQSEEPLPVPPRKPTEEKKEEGIPIGAWLALAALVLVPIGLSMMGDE